MKKIENDNLFEEIDNDSKAILMIHANWCGVCKKTLPIFEKIESETDGIEFIIMDGDKNPNSRKNIGKLDTIPHFVLFENGGIIHRQGASREETIKKILGKFSNVE